MNVMTVFDHKCKAHNINSSCLSFLDRRERERNPHCPKCSDTMHQTDRSESLRYVFVSYVCPCGYATERQIVK
jgi:predicted RNA-binding Zn-ribbon protein involved in translation (DUF1610 family)